MPAPFLSSPLALIAGILLLTVCIFIHELGHFLVARWCGAKVPRFSIFGLGQPIIARTWRGVEWCICWIPFGAYVQIPQLADLGEIEGGNEKDTPPLPPLGYRAKVLVALAGPVFNLLLATLLASVLWIAGQEVDASFATTKIGHVSPTLTLSDGREVPSPAAQAGLRRGDVIRSIDGHRTENWQDVLDNILFGAGSERGERTSRIVVERDGQLATFTLNPRLATDEKLRRIGVAPFAEYKIFAVEPESPGARAGLRADDRIIAIDAEPIFSAVTLFERLNVNARQPVTVRVQRAGVPVDVLLPTGAAKGGSDEAFGVTFMTDTTIVRINPFVQVGDFVVRSLRTVWSLINPFSDIRLSQMGSVIAMVDGLKQAAQAGWRIVLLYLVIINVGLGVLNLLPLPVLDGGHILFATIGQARGRPIAPEFIARLQLAFFVLLISMMLYVSFHDVRRIRRDFTVDKAPAETPAPTAVPADEPPAQP